MKWRVQKCNKNALPLIDILTGHPFVAQVNFPTTVPTAEIYKRHMRKEGGYGNTLSIVFHDPVNAQRFYNCLDVCKGSSFGTNFTLAIPFVQLANYWSQDKVAKHGLRRDIVRISVGLEDGEEIVRKVAEALSEVESLERAEKVHLMETLL